MNQTDNSYEPHGCYEVKLNRWFYFLQENNILWIAGVPLFPLIFFLLYCLKVIHLAYFVMSAIIAALMILAKIHSYPRCIDVTPNSVKICFRETLLKILMAMSRSHGSRIVKIEDREYTIYNIKSIECTQTPFERRMHVGQVHILGNVISSETENAVVSEKSLTIYGVKDFENTIEWMKEFIQIK